MSDNKPISELADFSAGTSGIVSGSLANASEVLAVINDLRDRVADLNDTVADMASQRAGTSAPTDNTTEGQIWADTTNDPIDLKVDPDGSGADHILLTNIEKGSVWPSFFSHRNGVDQTSFGTALTKAKFTTELYDTNSDFAHDADDSGGAAESRFTPTVAGKYLIIATLRIKSATDDDQLQAAIYKNGSEIVSNFITSAGGGSTTAVATAILDANGSSDYFEAYGANLADGTEALLGTATDTYFCGSRIA